MKNLNATVSFSQQCFLSGILLFSSFNTFALNDETRLAKEQLLRQLNQVEKVKPTLYFENNVFRLFGEHNTDLLREKSELLAAVDIFDENFGPSPKLDVTLMNSQMNLLQVDTSETSEHFLGFLSYQGLAKSQNIKQGTTAKKSEKYNILAHEACHKLLMNQVDEKGLKAESNGHMVYGHALLPDWFDEMAAVMCENQALTKMRLAEEIDSFIPFADFFVMENPAFTMVKEQAMKMMQQQRKKSNSKDGSFVMTLNVDDNNAQLSHQFYQQSALFGHFLIENLGRQIFKRLTQEFVHKNDVSAWLLQQLSLNNLAELDVIFKQFYQDNRL